MATLALWGGEPLKKTPFPAWPHFDDHERAALLEVLESGQWWRTPGTRTLEDASSSIEINYVKDLRAP